MYVCMYVCICINVCMYVYLYIFVCVRVFKIVTLHTCASFKTRSVRILYFSTRVRVKRTWLPCKSLTIYL